jgi:hypothetical protein
MQLLLARLNVRPLFVSLMLLVAATRVHALCDDGSHVEGCHGCACVGSCACIEFYDITSCRDSGTICYVVNTEEWDGGEGNCQYLCCEYWSWTCSQI